MNITIRADASEEMGTGHVMRCLTLADELKRRGAEVTFICRDLLPILRERIEQARHALRMLSPAAANEPPNDGPPHAHWLKAHWRTDAEHTQAVLREIGGVDWLVVDHYALDARWERQMRPQAARIMVIDDLADRAHDCDLLLDQTPGRAEEDYRELVPDACKLLTGAQYALLRPEFARLRPSAIRRRQRQEKVQRILVNFGGSAPEEISRKVLWAIAEAAPADIIVDFATGTSDPDAAGLTALAKEMPQEVNFHGFDADMAQLMHDADLAIGAGGVSALERACMGLPSIVLLLAENQQDNTRRLQARNAALVCPEPGEEQLGRLLGRLLQQPETWQAMLKDCATLTDGLGASLAAAALLPETSRLGAAITLRPVTHEDADTIYRWQHQPDMRRYFRNPRPPTHEEHAAWMKRILTDPGELAWIILQDDTPAGLLRLTERDDETWEIGILVDKRYRRHGIAHAAMKLLNRFASDRILLAIVHEQNHASQKLFESCGFAQTLATDADLRFRHYLLKPISVSREMPLNRTHASGRSG